MIYSNKIKFPLKLFRRKKNMVEKKITENNVHDRSNIFF